MSHIRHLICLCLFAAACEGPPGADGLNGTDGLNGADGVDGVDGVPQSKADLYEIQEFTTVSAGSSQTLDANCLDADDILLSGGCELVVTGDNHGWVSTDRAEYGASEADVSFWRCKAFNDSDGDMALSAIAVCVDVQ